MQSRFACKACCIYTNEAACFVCGDPTVDSTEMEDPTVSQYRNTVLRSYSGFAQYDGDAA